MNKNNKITIWTLILLVLFSGRVYAGKIYGDLLNVEYVKNYDGDTITFNIPNIQPIIGNKISIRVYGVDCPEIKGHCLQEKILAQKAKKFVQGKCRQGKRIDLTNIRRGKYFRIVANVIIDGEDLSDELLNNLLAIPYFGEKKENWCNILNNNQKNSPFQEK